MRVVGRPLLRPVAQKSDIHSPEMGGVTRTGVILNTNESRQFDLHPADQRRLTTLCGQFDENLKHVERRLQVSISRRGHHFRVEGETEHVAAAVEVIRHLYRETEATDDISPDTVHL